MTKILPFILILLVTSCKNDTQNVEINSLIGDWRGEFSHQTPYDNENHIKTLTFLNDSIGSNFADGGYAKYKIEDSILTFNYPQYKYKEQIKDGEKYEYIIKFKNIDSILIKPLSINAKNDFHQNDVYFNKIEVKNNHKYKKIGFYSTICYGSCPSLYVEINNSGDILFNGYRFTDKKGLYSGKIDFEIHKLLLKKINLIDWSKIKSEYISNHTDAPTYKLRIQLDNEKLINCKLYGSNDEPIELDNLLHLIKESYKFSDLKSDTLVKMKFQFQDLAKGIRPPPPNFKPIEVIK